MEKRGPADAAGLASTEDSPWCAAAGAGVVDGDTVRNILELGMEADVELTTLGILAVWIEEQRAEWRERGVRIWEQDGATIMAIENTPVVALLKESDYEWHLEHPNESLTFLSIIVGPDMGIEHCKVLIENAVEQVANL